MAELPREFKDFIQRKLGNAFPDFLTALDNPSPTSIRINPNKNYLSEGLEVVPWAPNGRYLPSRPIFTLDPYFHGGVYYVQEASSMFLEQALREHANLTTSLNVLDLSAAPGGKSTHILSLINKGSLLVSNEVIRSRASILDENIQKWGHSNCIVTNSDPKDFSSLQGFFDVIVVDAPCSGEGLFRKDADARKEWSPENVDLCASRQRRIVSDVWPALKENGILIYCTCTYNEKENEENLDWFSQQNDVEFLKVNTDPDWHVNEITKNKVVGYQFFPHNVKGEGFFLSVMRKTQSEPTAKFKAKKTLSPPSKKIVEQLRSWILNPEEKTFFLHNDSVFFLPKTKSHEAEALLDQLKVVRIGTAAVSIKHEKLIPEHALSLSIDLNKEHFTIINLSYDEAIKFLRKDVLMLSGFPKGFALVCYDKVPIGWVNVLDNRINNLYPAEWRIKMSAP